MAKHNYPYKKSVTISVWTVQFLGCFILLAASGWVLWVMTSDNQPPNFRRWRGVLTAAAGLQIGLVTVNITMNIVEIVLIARKRMPPALFLTNAVIKTLIWGILFMLNVVAMLVVGVVLDLILFLTSVIQLVHAAIIVHRKRHGMYEGLQYRTTDMVDHMSGMAVGVESGTGLYHENVDTEYKTPLAEPPSEYGNTTLAYSPRQTSPLYELDNRSRG
ncbi:hypothetical protein F4806DRAFT_70311 [Annulohypoxylon nitens]|nr:hypothetical protein F4806DRAFT_70311 [Annulohypoxylon nitens]